MPPPELVFQQHFYYGQSSPTVLQQRKCHSNSSGKDIINLLVSFFLGKHFFLIAELFFFPSCTASFLLNTTQSFPMHATFPDYLKCRWSTKVTRLETFPGPAHKCRSWMLYLYLLPYLKHYMNWWEETQSYRKQQNLR